MQTCAYKNFNWILIVFTWCAMVSGHCAVYSASRACPTSHGTRVSDRPVECYVELSDASSARPRSAVAIKIEQWCIKVVEQLRILIFRFWFCVKKSNEGLEHWLVAWIGWWNVFFFVLPISWIQLKVRTTFMYMHLDEHREHRFKKT